MATRQPTYDNASAEEQLRRGRDEARRVGTDIGEIAEDLRGLADAEVRLAKAETQQNLKYLVNGVLCGAVAAIHAMLALVFVFITVMLVLNIWLEMWASALITTGIIIVLTAAVGGLAYSAFKRFSIMPERTIDSLKEDLRWLKRQATSNGR